MNVKMSHDLGDFDDVPDFTDFSNMNKDLNKVLKQM